MIKVVLLGYGNVNSHLLNAFKKSEIVSVIQIFNRSNISLEPSLQGIPFTDKIDQIYDADVYIIGISDDSISTFSESLKIQDKLVVHTSGGAPMDRISQKNRRGIFYPLQTFSKNKDVNFDKIPICIEAENSQDFALLEKLGKTISEVVVEIDSEKRAKIHVSAVFVNNFVNYLYQIGEEILEEDDIPFDLLKPLIKETANKIQTLSPELAQTGPAKRNDTKTIEKHLKLLDHSPYKDVYLMLTKKLKQQWE
jgi:predicted short-subunit dehydrogenase-like oxidoreductase (DUF2520 family)